jgi:hypothetical protein
MRKSELPGGPSTCQLLAMIFRKTLGKLLVWTLVGIPAACDPTGGLNFGMPYATR